MKKRRYTIHIFFLCLFIFLYIVSINIKEFPNIILDTVINNIFAVETDESSTSTNIPVGDDMVELLARLVNGEARGESYEGQVAVAAVILNRVKSPKFPNTIASVIYQKGQFSCVTDGQFDVAIDEDSTVYKAAQEAMNGTDPTNRSSLFL